MGHKGLDLGSTGPFSKGEGGRATPPPRIPYSATDLSRKKIRASSLSPHCVPAVDFVGCLGNSILQTDLSLIIL